MPDPTGPARAGYRELFSPALRATSLTSVMAVFIGSLDSLIISTALPTVSQRLHGAELYAVALGAYLVASLVGLPLFGAMSDEAGPWRAFLFAGAVFGVASLLGGSAPSMLFVVLARAAQGFGAGGLFAVAYAAVGRKAPPHLQPHAFGLLSATWGVSSLVGPAVGALLIQYVGWRWVFWFNVPVLAVILPLARTAFRGLTGPGAAISPPNLPGPILLGLTAAAALASSTVRLPWSVPLAAIAVLLGFLFVLEERSSSRPVLGALRRPASRGAGAVIASGLTGLAMVTTTLYVPLFIQAGRGQPVFVAGAVLTCLSVAWTVGSMIAARMSAYGTRSMLAIGHASFATGSAVLILAVALHQPIAWLFAGLIACGVGIGFVNPSLFALSLADAGADAAGAATAGVQVLRSLGSGMGAAVAGLVFRLSVPQQLFDQLSAADPSSAIRSSGLAGFLDAALEHCWAVAFAVLLISALVVLRLPTLRLSRQVQVELTS